MKCSLLSRFSTVFLLLLLLGLHPAFAQELCVAPCEFRFAVYGDSRSDENIHKDIVSKIIATRPSLVLTTGDVVEGLFSPKQAWKEQWLAYDKIVNAFKVNNIGVYTAVGNHDIFVNKWVTDEYQKRAPDPSRAGSVSLPLRAGSTPFDYAFDKGSLRFISINSLRTNKLEPGKPQYEWLESELRDAQGTGKFVVPFFHIAIFSIGKHGSKKSLQKHLHPLFLKYGVKLVLQGHDHNYYRTYRCGYTDRPVKDTTKCTEGDLSGITYIVSGGGGAGLYNDAHKKEGLSGDKFDMANNYSIVDVFSDEIVLTTYASQDPKKVPYKKLDRLRCPLHLKSACEVLPVD